MSRAGGSTAVMARRVEAKDSLDDFPTPPWGTRALCERLAQFDAPLDLKDQIVWEPCANRRIMADPLGEYFERVVATDVHDYGYPLDAIGSFVGDGGLDLDVVRWPLDRRPDWIITNPPFNLAMEVALRAIGEAREGAAVLVRTAWLEGEARFVKLFSRHRPTVVSIFSERLPMVRGRWDPAADSATSYAWVIWNHRSPRQPFEWFEPGTRDRLTRPTDAGVFGYPARGELWEKPEELFANANAAKLGGRAPPARGDIRQE